VVHTSNPALRRLRQENCAVEARLSCITRPYLKKKKIKRNLKKEQQSCKYRSKDGLGLKKLKAVLGR
jgi:hypothetical protein